MTIEDDWWCHQHCGVIICVFYRPDIKKWVLVYKLHAWWCHNVDDVINRLLLSRPVTGISFKLIPLVELKLFNFKFFPFWSVKYTGSRWQKHWHHFCRSIIEGFYCCKFQVRTMSGSRGVHFPSLEKDLAWSRPKRRKGLSMENNKTVFEKLPL